MTMHLIFLSTCLLLSCSLFAAPENLALKATVSASSEHSAAYGAKLVVDGKLAKLGSIVAVGEWAAKGNKHPKGVPLTFTWKEPQAIAEVVYYGRANYGVECFKDYEIIVAGKPNHKGTLKCGDGPQRIVLPKTVKTTALTLKFLNAYPGPNPGAAEIQVYGASTKDVDLGKFRPAVPGTTELITQASEELLADLKAGKFGFDKLVVVKRHVLNPTHIYTYHAESFRGGGGLYIYDLKTGKLKTLVDSPKGEIIDVDVSFNGKEILFSWKKEGRNQNRFDPIQDFDAEGTFQVYRINADGSGLKQLTKGRCNNFNACWLPDGGIAYLSDRKNAFAYCWTTTSPILYRMDRDGENIIRLSASYLNDFTPAVLNDGRIVYSRWEYIDRPAIPIQGLWAMNPDGTHVSGVFGNRVLSPATFMEAHSMPESTDKIICILTSSTV